MSGSEHHDQTTIQQLEERLNRGWELIEQAERGGDSCLVARYTEHWLALLAEYEQACAAIPASEPQTDEE